MHLRAVLLATLARAEDDRHSYRHLCAVSYRGNIVSGGFLVRLNVMVSSAAHLAGDLRDYSVYTNRYNLSLTLEEDTGRQLRILEVIPHPRYTERGPNFNAAVALLDRSVNAELAITLDPGSYLLRKYPQLALTGWGSRDGNRVDCPQSVAPRIVPCAREAGIVRQFGFCTTNMPGSPIFDSGTPLVILTPRRPVILGMASWTFPFAMANLTFTRIPAIAGWIWNSAASLNQNHFPGSPLF